MEYGCRGFIKSSKFLSPRLRAEMLWITLAYSWLQWRMLDPSVG